MIPKPKKQTVVAIGGGELKDLDTLPIDKEIVKLSGKKKPTALFVPTASGDAIGYSETFKLIYGQNLGCHIDVLLLIREKPTRKEIERKILSADIIYVGGGNTARMLKIWKKYGVDRLLIEAGKKGTILSGISAGAICWFKYGLSDSRRFVNKKKDFHFIRVSGLGIIPCAVSPHHIREKKRRDPGLADMMRKTTGVGLAIDDNAALMVRGEKYSVLTSKPEVGIIKVFCKKGAIERHKIPHEGMLKDLFSR
jgi:dipeptidase E